MYTYLVIVYAQGREEPLCFTVPCMIEDANSPDRLLREIAYKCRVTDPSITVARYEILKVEEV